MTSHIKVLTWNCGNNFPDQASGSRLTAQKSTISCFIILLESITALKSRNVN